MKFLPRLREFLREHRIIYTVRGYDMRPALVYVKDVGMCQRTPLGRITSTKDLESYVAMSGFDDVEVWQSKIVDFTKPGQLLWLYRVEVK